VWNIAESRRVRTITYDDNRSILSLAFSPNGQFVLLGTTGARADVWSVTSGGGPAESYAFSDLSSKAVTEIAMSPDLSRIMMADEAGGIFGFQRGSPAAVDILGGGSDVLLALAFSPDGRRLLETSTDGFARVWDLENATLVTRFRIGSSGAFNEGSAAFSPDGSPILTRPPGAARLW
ncbi:unnamed protein product, partial [Phaeothamnion confervicola]